MDKKMTLDSFEIEKRDQVKECAPSCLSSYGLIYFYLVIYFVTLAN